MRARQPGLKTNDLISEMNGLRRSGRSADPFTLKRYKREARTIVKHSPAEGFCLLGMIGALERNLGNVVEYHQRSIEFVPGEATLIGQLRKFSGSSRPSS